MNGRGRTRLGFIGLGAMGSRMARRLLAAGHDLTVVNPTLEGEHAAYERCRPILAVLGRESFYLGPAGSGSTMKLCVNALLGLGVQALAEAIALGLKAGLERDRFLDVLGSTVVLSASQGSKLANVRKGAYPPAFPLRLMLKDFVLILESARCLSVTMPT